MTKALLKKQFLEVFAWVYRDNKKGKNRDAKGIVMFLMLYIAVFAMLGYIFWMMASSLCAPLVSVGYGWLYTAIMSLVGITLGVFGSVFNTYSSLYNAKDNDLLLSMPISPSKILFIRLLGVYTTGLLYELLVMIPAVIAIFKYAKLGILGYIINLIIPFVLSVAVLAVSCVLGFLVALISSKIKRKNMITVVLSLAFIVGYYYVYMQAYKLLQAILANSEALGNKIKTIVYPLYHAGLASMGNISSMLIFTGITLAVFAVIYIVLSRSFLNITTTNKGAVKAKYKENALKVGNVKSALLKKEFRRFLSSPTYILNCGLGIIIMPVATVALIIKGSSVTYFLDAILGNNPQLTALLGAAAVCLMCTMNDMTAPSVSLEGKTIDIAKSLPINTYEVLKAKIKLHLYLTLIPAALLTAAVLWIIKPVWYFVLLIPLAVLGFVVLTAVLGLVLNLKMPNLNWTNEAVPVKQSMSVFIALFGGWALVFALCGLYFGVRNYINPTIYLITVTAILFAVSAVFMRWLKTKGTKIFEEL